MIFAVYSLFGFEKWCISKIDSVSDNALAANSNANGNMLIETAGIGAYRSKVIQQDCFYNLPEGFIQTRLNWILYILIGLLAFEIVMEIYDYKKEKKKPKERTPISDGIANRSEPSLS